MQMKQTTVLFLNDWTLLQSNWSLKILYWSLLGIPASVGHLCRGFSGKCVDTARNFGDRPGQYPLSLLCIFPQQFLGIYQWENITIVLSTQTILTNISKFQEGRCWTGMDVKEKLVGQMFVPENETDHSKKLWKKSQERKRSWCFLLLLFVVITY